VHADHLWIGLGTALMDDTRAATWKQAEGAGYVTELFELNLPWLACTRCDAGTSEIGTKCAGALPNAAAGSPYAHRWIATVSLERTEDEASCLADPDSPLDRWCCRGRRTWCAAYAALLPPQQIQSARNAPSG
jgi:hypothetical protein